MSGPLTRLGDTDSGHGCWMGRSNDTASPDVFCNGIPNHRQGDHWILHCCPSIPECHDGFLLVGSPTVFTNGLQQARVGDPISCGGFVITGSPDTFVGP